MNRSAVLHIPMSQYAYGVDETRITLRLRVGREDIKKCIVGYGDRACRNTPVDFTSMEMTVVASDELFDYYEVTLHHPYKRLCYYFVLWDGNEEVYYYGDQFMKELVDDRSEYYQLPFNHRADIVQPPSWAKNAVIYNIFPDSFATAKEYISNEPTQKIYEDGERLFVIDDATRKNTTENQKGVIVHGKRGGTIKGITENVTYLEELGVNAIYINPLFVAGEYHKYDLIDYYHVDPCFGTDEDFKELVEVYHAHSIRVIIDGVFNHCGWRFFAFEDIIKNGKDSKYYEWFYGLQLPIVRPDNFEDYPNYECFGYERMMPKLNTANPEVRQYFCEVGKYWVREFHIDGWRLDVASEIDDYFWREFHRGIKEINPEAILIGEVWESANHWLDGKIFDSTMNYDFRKHCRRFFAEETIDARSFDARVTDMRMRYRMQTCYAQLNVLDSHDVSRFLSLCKEDKKKYMLAVVFQMCFPGMPSIFYGDEQGLCGVLEDEYRQPMEWNKRDGLYDFFKEIISIRRKNPALCEGSYKTVKAEAGSRLYVFDRISDDEQIRIFLNMGEKILLDDISENVTLLSSNNLKKDCLEQYGYAIFKMT